MPNHKSSVKRVRQSERRSEYNRYYKVMAKRAIKDVRSSTTYDEALTKYQTATKILDQVASRGIIHKNYASNNKSKLGLYVNSLKG